MIGTTTRPTCAGFFHGPRKGEYLTEGEKLFKENLDALRTVDAQRHYSGRNAPRVQVEASDSEGNKIKLTTQAIKELLQMSRRFKPSHPTETYRAVSFLQPGMRVGVGPESFLPGFFAINWCIRQCATSVSGEASASFIPATSSSSREAVKLPSFTIPR